VEHHGSLSGQTHQFLLRCNSRVDLLEMALKVLKVHKDIRAFKALLERKDILVAQAT